MAGIKLPKGVSLDLTVDTIVGEYGSYDLVYNTPDMFKYRCERFFERRYWSIEEMYKTMFYDYDPIENYRRYEDGWENNDDKEKRERGVEENDKEQTGRKKTGKTTEKDNVGNITNSTSTVSVSAYNSDGFLNDTKNVADTEGTENRNSEVNISDNEDVNRSLNRGVSENEDIGNERRKKYGSLAHGNIGVTTTQQMIESQRESVEFDFYMWIAKIWAKEFVVCVS